MNDTEKARAYDEALETARKINSGEGVPAPPGWTVCEVIFPELKEPEDERIKEDLIQWINEFPDTIWRGHYKIDILAWLEKQGENPTTLPKWKYKKDNEPLLRDSLILNKYGCVAKSPSGAIVSDVWVIDYDELAKLPKEESEKQGEQKSDDKVEPKFKVGDWIVYDGWTTQIKEVYENGYSNIHQGFIPIKREEEMRLWTIQDAKDGDVLWHSDSASNGIFIFKEIRYDGKVLCYCDYDSEDHFCTGEHHTCCWSNAKYIKPATKEQRDLLFQKMKEAGYEWDAEKKELKKISNSLKECEIEHIEHGKYYYCIKDYYAGGCKRASKGEVVQALRGMNMMALGAKANEYFIPVKRIVDVKPDWSEEDEGFLNLLLAIFTNEHPNGVFTTDNITVFRGNCVSSNRIITWLKCLKDRIQPQQEWSE